MAEETKDKGKHQVDNEQAGGDTSRQEQAYALPKIEFATFVLSINSSALVQLGLIEDPASGKMVQNLPMAKQTIDLLGMLEEKTRGNLSDDEENILKNILYELRMLYVKETS